MLASWRGPDVERSFFFESWGCLSEAVTRQSSIWLITSGVFSSRSSFLLLLWTNCLAWYHFVYFPRTTILFLFYCFFYNPYLLVIFNCFVCVVSILPVAFCSPHLFSGRSASERYAFLKLFQMHIVRPFFSRKKEIFRLRFRGFCPLTCVPARSEQWRRPETI